MVLLGERAELVAIQHGGHLLCRERGIGDLVLDETGRWLNAVACGAVQPLSCKLRGAQGLATLAWHADVSCKTVGFLTWSGHPAGSSPPAVKLMPRSLGDGALVGNKVGGCVTRRPFVSPLNPEWKVIHIG